MRLSASNVYHKKNTRNTLSMIDMNVLHELGLVNVNERSGHRECGLGVEELLQILPACIVKDKVLYSLRIYKNAFDVQCVAYYRNGDDCLFGMAVDDIPNTENPTQSANLVDALYLTLIWVNEYYPSELQEYKDKLKHYVNSKS